MNGNKVLDLIINFVKAINIGEFCDEDNNLKIFSPKYLLNQILRQISITNNNYYISRLAIQKWKEISDDDIKNYSYRKIVTCNNEFPIFVKCYKNNSKQYEEKILTKGNKFTYKDVFHDEHMIPIDIIIKQLCDLDKNNNLSYENINKVLNQIYICKMLKEEDRKIKEKYKRPFNLTEIIENIYKPVGINIIKLIHLK